MRVLFLMFFMFFALVVKSQAFLPGYYIDRDGKKIEGQIKYNFKYKHKGVLKELQYFIFKSPTVKKTTVDADMVQSFFVGREKYVPLGGSETVFLHVVLDGPVKIYARYSEGSRMGFTGGTGPNGLPQSRSNKVKIADYLYGDSPDNAVDITRENFPEIMTKAMSAVPQMGQLIKDGRYDLGSTEEMIKMYYAIKNRKTL